MAINAFLAIMFISLRLILCAGDEEVDRDFVLSSFHPRFEGRPHYEPTSPTFSSVGNMYWLAFHYRCGSPFCCPSAMFLGSPFFASDVWPSKISFWLLSSFFFIVHPFVFFSLPETLGGMTPLITSTWSSFAFACPECYISIS